MYSQSFLVSSVRGSGSLPTTAASAASGWTGLPRAFFGEAAFFGLGIRQLERAGLGSQAKNGSSLFSVGNLKLGKPVLHIYNASKKGILNQDSLRLEIQALTDFLCSNKIEILNVAGPRESNEPGVYEWTLTMLRSLNRAASVGISQKQVAG
jgi:hypothetical protein